MVVYQDNSIHYPKCHDVHVRIADPERTSKDPLFRKSFLCGADYKRGVQATHHHHGRLGGRCRAGGGDHVQRQTYVTNLASALHLWCMQQALIRTVSKVTVVDWSVRSARYLCHDLAQLMRSNGISYTFVRLYWAVEPYKSGIGVD